MSKDYYTILGVSKEASEEDIKKAYKKLARQYHPDVSKEANAEEKFKEINEAASVLLDKDKRAHYDRFGSTDGMGGFGGGGAGFNPRDFGINIEDIFEQFGFGSFGFGGGSSRRKDYNVYSEVVITLDDVYFGSEKEVTIRREIECEVCEGVGAEDENDVETCPTCKGNGVVIEMQRTILGAVRTQRTCPTCNGTGSKIKKPCKACHGKGTKVSKEDIKIKIPKGVESGVTLRVSGKGNYNPEEDDYADLYLKIFIEEHKKYELEGNDLYMTLNVNFIQAILGDEVDFKHFDKTLAIKIPEGTQPGTQLRLKDRGLPLYNSSQSGDLYVRINVEIPTKVTSEQKKILMDYAGTVKDKGIFGKLKNLFK